MALNHQLNPELPRHQIDKPPNGCHKIIIRKEVIPEIATYTILFIPIKIECKMPKDKKTSMFHNPLLQIGISNLKFG